MAEFAQVVRDPRVRRERRETSHGLLREDLDDAPGERSIPSQRLVEHHAHRVPIGGWTTPFGARLLGGHIERGPLHAAEGLGLRGLPQRPARDPEVQHFDVARRRHEDVARLDVAVHEPPFMERLERRPELRQRAPQPIQVARALGRRANPIEPGHRPRHELHREVEQVLCLPELEEFDQVGVPDLGEAPEFSLEREDVLRLGPGPAS